MFETIKMVTLTKRDSRLVAVDSYLINTIEDFADYTIVTYGENDKILEVKESVEEIVKMLK